jgi:ribosomal protein L7/L12
MNSSLATKEAASLIDVGAMFQAGASRDEVIGKMREAGLDKIDCMLKLQSAVGITLGEAKRLVHLSPAWSDCREADDDLHMTIEDNLDEIADAK